jgi:protein TonB
LVPCSAKPGSELSPPAARFTPKAAAPLGDPARWVSPDDYPAGELRRGHEGTTRFRLSIGSDGRVSNCAVTGSSGWPVLDAATCTKLAARGKFRPATNEAGEKVAGT